MSPALKMWEEHRSMARDIFDSRLGRALMTGVPVALAILGAEMLDGAWKLDRDHGAVSLSWASTQDTALAAAKPALRLTTCIGDGCGRFSVAVSVPENHIGTEVASLARSMVSVVTGECTEGRTDERSLATA
jgi:hypothetical protein